MSGWSLGNLSVVVQLGHVDDSDIDIVVKTKDVTIGSRQATITLREGSEAEQVLYWPGVSMDNPNRRTAIYSAAINALETATVMNAQRIGFFTMGFELSRIPSWEVAEEIVKAIITHSKTNSGLNRVFLIASSPIQVSSFQFALNNITTLAPE